MTLTADTQGEWACAPNSRSAGVHGLLHIPTGRPTRQLRSFWRAIASHSLAHVIVTDNDYVAFIENAEGTDRVPVATHRYRRRTLQDGCLEQVAVAQELAVTSPDRTLQDLCSMQLPLFVGLISMLTDSTLQDHIATTTGRLVASGYDILGVVPGMEPERSLHEKTCPQSGTTPESARAV